jgi:hypothetical protein
LLSVLLQLSAEKSHCLTGPMRKGVLRIVSDENQDLRWS